MATFKAIFGKLRADGTHNIRIRVTHNRSFAYIPTDWYVEKQYVRHSKRQGTYITDHGVLYNIENTIRRYRSICNEHDLRGLDAKEVVRIIERGESIDVMSMDFAQYVRNEARELEMQGKKGTATNRITAINALCRVLRRDIVPLSLLTRKRVRDAFSHVTGNRAPSLYKAQLQASFNKLMKEYNIDADVIPFNPFSGIEIPKCEPPKKRALDAEIIKKVYSLPDMELTEGTKGLRFNLAKDVFMLSFFLVGMNAVDLYNCTQYKNDRIIYERTKTRTRRSDNALMSVLVPDMAKPLFEKYFDEKSENVFRFWRMYADHGTFNAALNKGLKQVGEEVGVKGLTFYAARHSWATIAVNDCGIDKWTVHLALNHVDPATAVTDIYIKKSWKPVDEANGKVIEKVFG